MYECLDMWFVNENICKKKKSTVTHSHSCKQILHFNFVYHAKVKGPKHKGVTIQLAGVCGGGWIVIEIHIFRRKFLRIKLNI